MTTDAQAINSVLDEALTCHVGFVDDDGPTVVPAIHARIEGDLYVRTTAGSALARAAGAGARLCVTAVLVDGLVLARSQAGHELNQRTVVARGTGSLVTDEDEKLAATAAVVDHLVAGRARHSRPPTADELAEIELVKVPLTDVRLDARTGPPNDTDEDLSLHHWAGVLGVRPGFGPAFPAPDLPYDRPVPSQLTNYSRSARPQDYR